jgi:hypothetical protein|tara:strand:+ start:1468 stop:1734 length:267 start_codon:yes stop_codon:yes gene_type:complete
MGKLTKKDVEVLENSGVLDEETTAGIRAKGLASGRNSSAKRYMLTTDGTWVSPTLYWRGAKDTEASQKMQEFNTKFGELLTEFATDRK